MLTLSEPNVVERGPYKVVGAYAVFQGEQEPWDQAYALFAARQAQVRDRVDDGTLGFLYRPHRDHPEIAEDVRAVFVGVEVRNLEDVPEALATTTFSGGKYAIVASLGDTGEEAAEGVGAAIGMLSDWLPAHGYDEGDACFAASVAKQPEPQHVEFVYIKLEPRA